MPAQNLLVPHAEFHKRTTRHLQVISGMASADAQLQKLLAELVMMRLFDEFMDAIDGIACRLACGTSYVDGSAPKLLAPPARSTAKARDLFQNHGRVKPKFTKWSKTKFIKETTEFVLDPTDTFIQTCDQHGNLIAEMQAVRNRVAHGGTSARVAYAKIVKRHYGVQMNHISPGLLLLTPRFSPPLIHRYVSTCRVIVNGCAGV